MAANAEIIPYLYSSLSARRIHTISEATKLRHFRYDWRFGRPFPFYNHWRRKFLKEMNTAVLSSFSIPINQTRCFENLHHFEGREQGKTCKERTKTVWLHTSLKLKIKLCGVMSRYQQIDWLPTTRTSAMRLPLSFEYNTPKRWGRRPTKYTGGSKPRITDGSSARRSCIYPRLRSSVITRPAAFAPFPLLLKTF